MLTPAPTPSGPPPDAIATFHSRPDLRAPKIEIDATAAGDDYLFVTPRYGGAGEGVMILDAAGELVWLHRIPGRTGLALQPTEYRGQPALWWWEGAIEGGLGDGEFVIIDRAYRELARVRAVARPADLHELLITPRDSGYLLATEDVEREGQLITDMLVQEVDIATGRLLWEWRASDHIDTSESVEPRPDAGAWDYLHFNAIDVDAAGDLLLSARHTDAIYKVSRRDGSVVWRLGGMASDFELPDEAVFHRQHDARWLADGTLSLFDNATDDAQDSAQPRGLVLRLDEAQGSVELVRELRPPRTINASSQGNLAIDDDGQATIGWGSANLITGYDPAGDITFDAAMPGGFSSYRAFRAPWRGRPLDDPIVAVDREGSGSVSAWVSWNGATEVTEWQLLVGQDSDTLRDAGRVPRDGFETELTVPDGVRFVVVRAIDRRGRVLGTSRATDVSTAVDAGNSADVTATN